MKVGIVTIYDLGNYGNRLQNYALTHVLRKTFRCRVQTLVSRRERPFENGNYGLWLKNRIAKACCVVPSLAEKRWGANMTRWANFHRWSKKYIPTRFFYRQPCLPKRVGAEYDLFFAGSDQIWNLHFPSVNFDDTFLRFAKDGQKVAYAASFGVDSLPEERRASCAADLGSFAHLSLREQAGARLAHALTGREAPVVIDPVMLLTPEAWRRVAKKPRVDLTKPYVLKYYLGDGDETVDRWAAEQGYAVYPLLDPTVPELYSAGPGEFLTLLANASLVASDSFHCIAFSILFQRPFLVYRRKDGEADMTSRLDTLLQTFRFSHRWKDLLSPKDYLSCDFSATEDILEERRAFATDYIRTALNRKEPSHAKAR